MERLEGLAGLSNIQVVMEPESNKFSKNQGVRP